MEKINGGTLESQIIQTKKAIGGKFLKKPNTIVEQINMESDVVHHKTIFNEEMAASISKDIINGLF